MADPSNDYFAAREQQRQWDGSKSSMGGYGASGLVGTGRQLRRTRGGSFIHVPSEVDNIATGGGGGGYPRVSTTGPTPLSTGIATPERTEQIRYARAEGVAGNYNRPSPGSGGMNFPTINSLANAMGNVMAPIAKGIAARRERRGDQPAEPPSFSSRQTTPTGGGDVSDQQPFGPPTGFAAPNAADNRTYTTNIPMQLGSDPFVGPDTDELGRPKMFSSGGQSGGQSGNRQPWGPPTGDPKHGPIFLGENQGGEDQGPQRITSPSSSRVMRRPAGEQRRPVQRTTFQRPSARGSAPSPTASATSGAGGQSVYIDDYANQEGFPDTYGIAEGIASPQEELQARRAEVYARRPQSSGRVAPGRPGGPRQTSPAEAIEPMIPNEANLALDAEDPMGLFMDNEGNPVPSPQGTSGDLAPAPYEQGQLFDAGPASPTAPAQEEAPTAPAGQIPGQRELRFDRPQSSGRVAPGRPGGPGRVAPGRPGGTRFAAEQRRQQQQAQVQQAAANIEFPATYAQGEEEDEEGMQSGPYTMNASNELRRRSEEFRRRQSARPGSGFRYWRT